MSADLETAKPDRFEREFGHSLVFGPVGSVVAGVLAFLLRNASGNTRGDTFSSLLFALALVAYVFVYGRLLLIRWLISKRSWSYTTRRVLFAPLFVAPGVVIALAQLATARS